MKTNSSQTRSLQLARLLPATKSNKQYVLYDPYVLCSFFVLFFFIACNPNPSPSDSGTDTTTATIADSETENTTDTTPDTGSETNADSDADTDSDTDTDGGSDSDNDSNSATIEDTDTSQITDGGVWEWQNLPQGEDCGPGCMQVTFSKEVRIQEWDVWDSKLVYQYGEEGSDKVRRVIVVDTAQKNFLLVPLIRDTFEYAHFSFPTIYQNTVCFGQKTYEPENVDVICADIDAHTQKVVNNFKNRGPEPIRFMDLYENRLVSTSGCGVASEQPQCYFDLSDSGEPVVLSPTHYGSHNSIWGDIVVWYSEGYFVDSVYYGPDVKGYNFATQTFFDIAKANRNGKLFARIYKNKVVYQDLQFGTDIDGMGDWNHAAVFVYDIETQERIQITNGEWIAAYPDIFENIVVWADYRACSNPNNADDFSNVEIWGYNLDTKKEFKITNLPGRGKTTPRIWGDKVYVLMYTVSGVDAVFMFDLPAQAKKK